MLIGILLVQPARTPARSLSVRHPEPCSKRGIAGGMLPRLAIFVSRSSAPRRWELPTFVDAVKTSGFDGVEIALADLGGDEIQQKASADAIRSSELQLIVDISSAQSIATQSPPSPLDHVKTFESQLHGISALGDVVSHVNCTQSGDHRWDVAASAEYLGEVLPLSAQFLEDHRHIGRHGRETDIMGGSPHHLTGISHETNARGILRHHNVVRDLMEILPPIRITSDIQQWHDTCGYQWGFGGNDDDEIDALRIEVVPHIDHIRASLIGTSLGRETIAPHDELWRFVWGRKAKRGVEQVTITPNLQFIDTNVGGDEDKTLWEQTEKVAAFIRCSYDSIKIERPGKK